MKNNEKYPIEKSIIFSIIFPFTCTQRSGQGRSATTRSLESNLKEPRKHFTLPIVVRSFIFISHNEFRIFVFIV